MCEGLLPLHLFRCAHPVLQTHSSAYSEVGWGGVRWGGVGWGRHRVEVGVRVRIRVAVS